VAYGGYTGREDKKQKGKKIQGGKYGEKRAEADNCILSEGAQPPERTGSKENIKQWKGEKGGM